MIARPEPDSPGKVRTLRSGVRTGRRLIVVSNRAPIRIVQAGGEEQIQPTVGGVGSTFLRLLERDGGVWVAWAGGRTQSRRVPMPPTHPRFELVFVELTERDVTQYYYGMCNRGLWPLMHFMTPICHFNRSHWNVYQRVNQNFADAVAAELRPGDMVWVQDFHLALTPRMIRARRPKAPIGIFWHVPFPPEQVFRVFPWRRELLAGMLGADLIGFHTRPYVVHFMNACERLLEAQVDRARGQISFDGRIIRVGAFPLGIPVDYFEGLAASERVRERVARIKRALRDQQIVLGVDRLDYTKGILERVYGFERFLEQNPAYHRHVTLVLIAVPSRTKVGDYAQLKRQLDEQVGRVIGRFSSEGWVPIRYLYTQFPPEELIAYYQASEVALLTPLRDGMNLVAKEYIASHPADDGVLILSEFAGAAEELKEALLVNPYDVDEIAARLKQALAMPAEVRAHRMRALRARVRANNLDVWSNSFLNTLTGRLPLEQAHEIDDAAD